MLKQEIKRITILNRILSNKLTIGKYTLIAPSLSIKIEAQELYNDIVYKNRFEEWLTEKECIKYLVQDGLCTPNIDLNLIQMEKSVESIKISIYDNYSLPHKLEQERKKLENIRKKYEELVNIRHSLDYLTLNGFAEMVKRQYILYKTLYDGSELAWKSFNDIDIKTMDYVLGQVNDNIASISDLRDIARNDPWRSYWSIEKSNIFRMRSVELTDEQRSLILFSKMYDGAHEHPRCPDDTIFNDDDAFDGWLLKERENKREEAPKKRNINSKLANATEIFLPVPKGVSPQDHIRKVSGLNSTTAKIIKQKRNEQIKAQGVVKDQNLLDNKLDRQMKFAKGK